jgi:hypothetical protein
MDKRVLGPLATTGYKQHQQCQGKHPFCLHVHKGKKKD